MRTPASEQFVPRLEHERRFAVGEELVVLENVPAALEYPPPVLVLGVPTGGRNGLEVGVLEFVAAEIESSGAVDGVDRAHRQIDTVVVDLRRFVDEVIDVCRERMLVGHIGSNDGPRPQKTGARNGITLAFDSSETILRRPDLDVMARVARPVMTDVLTDEVARFVRAAGPSPDDALREMDEYAAESGFPHVGPEVGGTLALLARMTDASSVFEFGSGYGYSAYWFARALPDDGRIVLTEIDEDELEMAREYMQTGGFEKIAEYELGDALEIVDSYDGPFDLVLLDHQKRRYPEAFDAVRSKVPVGGAIVADNAMTAGSIQFETVLEILESRDQGLERRDDDLTEDIPDDATDATRGIATYLATVRDDEAFETIVLPLGEGIAVSYRTE